MLAPLPFAKRGDLARKSGGVELQRQLDERYG